MALRHDLHAYPELAFDERRTSDVVAAYLEQLGLEVHRGLAGTGVVGVLRGPGQRAVGLRADMDALPIHEQNLFPHRSRHEGRMHACGHDGHTAMLLGAARALAEKGDPPGTVVFIFQPAEETDGGARVMLEQGLFRLFPVDAVFGMHNWPGLEAGKFAIHTGPVMACADQFDIVLAGHGGHAAMPQQAKDPLIAAAALVQALQTVVSRVLDPLDPAVVSITQLRAGGEAYNVIPSEARIGGTVRAFRGEVQDRIEAALERIAAGVAAAHGVQAHVDYRRGYPPTINTSAEAALCARVAREVAGEGNALTHLPPSMGAEDFSYMLRAKPGCYVWIGNGEAQGGCMLHNPHYDFNDAILPLGVAYWTRLVERFFAASA